MTSALITLMSLSGIFINDRNDVMPARRARTRSACDGRRFLNSPTQLSNARLRAAAVNAEPRSAYRAGSAALSP